MENPSSFDLNLAIQIWREELAQSPACGSEQLDELESHLRDSVSKLQSNGLSEEEAFLVAAHRVGGADALGLEFGKLNPGLVWRTRAVWMLAGMLVFLVGLDLSRGASVALVLFGSLATTNGFALGWLGVAAKSVVFGVVVVGLWFLTTGRLRIGDQRLNQFLKRRRLALMVLVVGVLILKLVPTFLEIAALRRLTPWEAGQTYMIRGWFDFVAPIMATVLLVVMLGRLLFRLNGPTTVGRGALWLLILPLAIPPAFSPAHAQDKNTAVGLLALADKQDSATLDQVMTLWRAGKKDEAVGKFLVVDFSRRPLFPLGSVLNYTEAQFMALPQAARDKLAKQMNEDIRTLKEICAHVRDTGKSALEAGDKAKSGKCTAQLKKCGEAFDQPDSLALLKLVGKALKKMAI